MDSPEFDWGREWAISIAPSLGWMAQNNVNEDASTVTVDGDEYAQPHGTGGFCGQYTVPVLSQQESLDPPASDSQSQLSQLPGNDRAHHHGEIYCTCSHCDIGFSSLQALEAHANEAYHDSFACDQCSTHFETVLAFENHQLSTGHAAFACNLEHLWSGGKCSKAYHSWSLLLQHQNDQSYYFHSKRHSLCEQCKGLFRSDAELTRHAAKENREARQCSVEGCNSSFTREADKLRHVIQHSRDGHPKYPCPHCHRHRGVKGFYRKDHLTQHLRNYHNIEPERGYLSLVYACSHINCPERRFKDEIYVLRGENHGYPFKTMAERTKHLKEVHDECQFPCPIPYCDKVGGQGYMRKSDLVKHINAKHPKAPANPQLQLQSVPEMAMWNVGTPSYETTNAQL